MSSATDRLLEQLLVDHQEFEATKDSLPPEKREQYRGGLLVKILFLEAAGRDSLEDDLQNRNDSSL